MRKHVQILAWLYIIIGVLGGLGALAAFGLITGFGLLSGDPAAMGAMSIIGSIVGIVLMVVSIPNIIVGVGLLQDWGGWVLVAAVVLGVLNLANFPVGTALGIYTFWVAAQLSNATESFG